jgi:hypothetical protein
MSWDVKSNDSEENPFNNLADASATPHYLPAVKEAPAWLLESQKGQTEQAKNTHQDISINTELNRFLNPIFNFFLKNFS